MHNYFVNHVFSVLKKGLMGIKGPEGEAGEPGEKVELLMIIA